MPIQTKFFPRAKATDSGMIPKYTTIVVAFNKEGKKRYPPTMKSIHPTPVQFLLIYRRKDKERCKIPIRMDISMKLLLLNVSKASY